MSEKIYGVADKAWQCVVGCDPHMPCAPRCWARKTVARIVECQTPQHPERAEFFQIALTPDGKQWSGKTFLDEAHLTDPLKWRKPALIATGFHGDWGRLPRAGKTRMAAVMALATWHKFIPLTKQPQDVLDWALDLTFEDLRRWMNLSAKGTEGFPTLTTVARAAKERRFLDGDPHALDPRRQLPPPIKNVSIGGSVMNQAEADRMRESMAHLAAMGWNTHVWYEPAIGPVDWRGWEFLRGIIVGFESGSKARPGHPAWARDTRDWCLENHVPFDFKQWGNWIEVDEHGDSVDHLHDIEDRPLPVGPRERFISRDGHVIRSEGRMRVGVPYHWMRRVTKAEAGRLLDGREWNEAPGFGQ